MADQTFLDWPFFQDRHRTLAAGLDAWATAHLGRSITATPMQPAASWSTCWAMPGFAAHSGAEDGVLDVRTLCA